MRILRLAQYIINYEYKEFSKNSSGYGRSVWDISRYSSKMGNEEYLYTFGNKDKKIIENVHIVEGNNKDVYSKIDKKTIIGIIKMIGTLSVSKGISFKEKLACIYYYGKYGYIKNIIDIINPDVIHIHGLTFATRSLLDAALESGKPVVVTLHGLNMNTSSSKAEVNYEIEQIKYLNDKNVCITVIGSGMKNTIESMNYIEILENIKTVNHGIDSSSFNFSLNKVEIKEKLNILNKKVLISVGSLSERRNQIQLISSISKLSESEKNEIIVYIIGDGPYKQILHDEIRKFKLEQTIFLLGNLNHSELSAYYTMSDMTLLLSKVEGFGRPILESYLFGVPVIAFNDLDAVNDLYIEGGMFLIDKRSDEAVIAKIRELISTEVNSDLIKAYASKKTWDEVSLKYEVIYKEILN